MRKLICTILTLCTLLCSLPFAAFADSEGLHGHARSVRSRFEEEIEFKLPNENERLAIMENNLKSMPLDYDLDLEKLVKLTKGLSGRDIKEKILKTSLHNAISNDCDIITMQSIEYALNNMKIKDSDIKGMFE